MTDPSGQAGVSTPPVVAADHSSSPRNSGQLDCKQAIYTLDIGDSADNVTCYDSVEQCVNAIRKANEADNSTSQQPKASKPEIAAPAAPAKLERQFLPEQMPTANTNRKLFRSVLERMTEYQDGPLGMLRKWMDEKVRVKVWTRGVSEIRGFATAFIVAFDKHWNLALVDVDEHFHRPRHRKTFCTDAPVRQVPAVTDLPIDMAVGSSTLRILKVQGKREVCVRHAPQLLVRGEHVVMVAKFG